MTSKKSKAAVAAEIRHGSSLKFISLSVCNLHLSFDFQ